MSGEYDPGQQDAAAVAFDAQYYRCKAEELSRDALATTSHNRETLLHIIGMLRSKADELERTAGRGLSTAE